MYVATHDSDRLGELVRNEVLLGLAGNGARHAQHGSSGKATKRKTTPFDVHNMSTERVHVTLAVESSGLGGKATSAGEAMLASSCPFSTKRAKKCVPLACQASCSFLSPARPQPLTQCPAAPLTNNRCSFGARRLLFRDQGESTARVCTF